MVGDGCYLPMLRSLQDSHSNPESDTILTKMFTRQIPRNLKLVKVKNYPVHLKIHLLYQSVTPTADLSSKSLLSVFERGRGTRTGPLAS